MKNAEMIIKTDRQFSKLSSVNGRIYYSGQFVCFYSGTILEWLDEEEAYIAEASETFHSDDHITL